MNTFNLQIVAPDRIIYDGEATFLLVRTTLGDIGIQANHQKLIAPLVICEMKVEFADRDPRFGAISGGFLKVGGNKVTVVTTTCEWKDEIDLDRAERALEKAQALREKAASKQEMDLAEIKLKRALNRISVAKK